jgi:hypothetical protein
VCDLCDQRAVVGVRQATGAPRSGPITQPLEPFGIAAMQAAPHGEATAAQLGGNGLDSPAFPTVDDHPGMHSPIRRPMSTGGQFADGACLPRHPGPDAHARSWASQPSFLFRVTSSLLYPLLRNVAVVLQSHIKGKRWYTGRGGEGRCVPLQDQIHPQARRSENGVSSERRAQSLAELSARIGAHVRRAEVRRRLQRYLQGLLASVERKNGGPLAEALGEPNAHGVQRLLAEADWDEEAVRDELRAYVLEHLCAKGAVLVVDETGFLKKGKKSAGVARHYSGTAGRRENCQMGVLLLYASASGHAFLDRALYLPEEWTADRVRCREAGIPEEVAFARHRRAGQSDALPGLCRRSPGGVGRGRYSFWLRVISRLWLEEQQQS